MINISNYKKAPPILLGMKKLDAVAFCKDNNFPASISIEDGKSFVVPGDVRILIEIKNGVVVKTKLDGIEFELEGSV